MSIIDRHSVTAVANVTNGNLNVTGGSVTLDESWSPYCKASLTVTAPDRELLAKLDPRNRVRVRLTLTQSFGTSEPVSVLSEAWEGMTLADLSEMYAGKKLSGITSQYYRPFNQGGSYTATTRTFDLGLRARPHTYKDGTVSLDLASDEALLQDYALVSMTPYQPVGVNLRPIVQYVLAQIGAVLIDGDADATFDADVPNWLPGVDAWSFLEPLVQQANLILWCDEKRRWHLTDSGTLKPGIVALTADNTITGATDDITREGDWFDAVVITYTWTDNLDLVNTRYDVAGVDGYSKVLHLEYDTAYPGPGGAQAVLNRANDKAHQTGVSAVSRYDVEPTTATTISLPDTDLLKGVLASVSWDLETLEMQVGTRGLLSLPPNSWGVFPAGIAWTDIPAGTSWHDFDLTGGI